ncbi:uncharacterized protein LOC106770049 [Vigna radiata var. radiata]|uniref:Uncharacterized protein LOC106770049 n=1 Tax=Vigna radiata var. radiata TaxID=3916 RepID=A0A1S3UZJ2_VIGRR|nr:uncharacterized protein LOC106770049 [Vigna radiata var. radiata]
MCGLWDSSHGFIVNDTCIIEVRILIHKLEDEKQVDESVRVDFRGIGKVEKKFIPLLKEVCSRYPSLIDNKKRKSQIFIESAFTALGRVLYFLKTKKVRDMDYNACNHLQTLWEELETFEFDLLWLKPHVQSALGMTTSLEKVLAIKRLEEKVTILEDNIFILEKKEKTLRTKRIEAELNLEINRRALVKAKKSIENCDLNAELGYGKP